MANITHHRHCHKTEAGLYLAPRETQQAVLVGEGRRPEVRGPPPGTLTLG